MLAAGVWSAELSQALDLALPIRPVKGQILTLRTLQPHAPRRIIWAGDAYLVPKVDGQLILGATEEDGNYERRPTLAGVNHSPRPFWSISPGPVALTVEGVWAGLRPAVPDRYPVVGRAPGLENLILATAHFRNGILLGPAHRPLGMPAHSRWNRRSELAAFGPERFR